MKQTRLHTETNVAACLLLLIVSVLSFNCIESPSEFKAPTYDTQISIPVLDTTQYFKDIVKKDTLFKFNPLDSTYSAIFATGLIPVDSLTNSSVTLEEFIVKGLSVKLKEKSVIDGTMNFEFSNGLPLVLKFQMNYLKWDSAKVQRDTLFKISPSSDSILAADVDTYGIVIGPKISNIAVFLTGAQIDTMALADSVYMKLYFNIGSVQNSVKFRNNDYIQIRSSFNASCTVNKP